MNYPAYHFLQYRSPFMLLLAFFALIFSPVKGQTPQELLQSGLHYRNIGPANQGGRITDIEADPADFKRVFIAVASGGVWSSSNAGTTWEPIFDQYETASIGDIALDPNDKNTIWVGTGEANNRNSVSWGNGVYKSTNGGQSFENMGLETTHQIARVLVHPEDSEDVCVCAIGHLWGYSGERGLFQTKDGGKQWKKPAKGLPNDGKTGCTDIVRDPKNPAILYAAFYERIRKPWTFNSGGENGGIFKSTNNGKSWKKLSHGLPRGATGRIGLAIYEKDPNILMAIVEAEKTDTLAIPGSGIYRSEDGGEHWSYVNTYNNRPFYYSQIRINPHNDQRVYALTTRFMVSEDGGKTFTDGSEDQEVHGDFHAMWLDPTNADRYYLGADKGLSLTHDHGQHFTLIDNLPIAQFYRINYDMRDPYYVYGGLQDNGSYAMASFSRDARGILSDANWKMHWGDGQESAFNPNDWTDGYSSMEKGTFFKYNPRTRDLKRISPSPMNTLNYWEYFDKNEEDMASAARYNWSAPLIMSPHSPSTIYAGGNYLYRSPDKGKTWKIISPDLSTNHPEKRVAGKSGGLTPDNSGAEYHCAIVGISVSEITEDLIWVCTDDGNVQLTTNAGASWQNLRSAITGVPEGLWASKIQASRFDPQSAYVTFDGHRSDDFGTYVFKTDDMGKSWTKITNGFTPGETVRVIIEDLINPNLLFAGTETGVWFSLNKGASWERLKLNMPTVSVYDLKIHPRDHDLIVGSHGRGIWILDDISPLQQWEENLSAQKVHLFDQKESTVWNNLSRGGQRGHFWFAGENPKSIDNTSTLPRARFDNLACITYFVGADVQDSIELEIMDRERSYSKKIKLEAKEGLHRFYWDRTFDASAFTSTELEELDEIMATILDNFHNSTVQRIYRSYKAAKSSDKKRTIIEPLTRGYLRFPIDDKFLTPRATIGSYVLRLSAGDEVSAGVLVIRDDPMNE